MMTAITDAACIAMALPNRNIPGRFGQVGCPEFSPSGLFRLGK